MRMRLCALLLAATPALTGFSVYDDLTAWQAVVGAHALETFDDVPDQGIPEEGGSIVLDGFAIEADGNHATGYEPCFDLCPPKVEGGVFIGDVHEGPTQVSFNRFVFHSPVSAFALEIFDIDLISVYGDGFSEFLFLDIDERRFLGIVLDTPVSSIGFSVDYETYHIDDVRWVTVPEPSTALLLGTGLAAVAARRRRPR